VVPSFKVIDQLRRGQHRSKWRGATGLRGSSSGLAQLAKVERDPGALCGSRQSLTNWTPLG
jgi:hypothetical protein